MPSYLPDAAPRLSSGSPHYLIPPEMLHRQASQSPQLPSPSCKSSKLLSPIESLPSMPLTAPPPPRPSDPVPKPCHSGVSWQLHAGSAPRPPLGHGPRLLPRSRVPDPPSRPLPDGPRLQRVHRHQPTRLLTAAQAPPRAPWWAPIRRTTCRSLGPAPKACWGL